MERAGSRRTIGVALLLVAVSMVLGGFGGGCISMMLIHPQSPNVLAGGSAGAPIPFSFKGEPDETYDIDLDVSVDAAMTRPQPKGALYAGRVDYELDLSRGSPAKSRGRLDDQLLDRTAGASVSGLWRAGLVTTDSSGVVEGSVLVRPAAPAHGIQHLGVQLTQQPPFIGAALAFLGAGLFGVLLLPVAIFLTVARKKEPDSDYALRPLTRREPPPMG